MFDRFFDTLPPPPFSQHINVHPPHKKCSQPLNVYQLCISFNVCLYCFHISVVLICQQVLFGQMESIGRRSVGLPCIVWGIWVSARNRSKKSFRTKPRRWPIYLPLKKISQSPTSNEWWRHPLVTSYITLYLGLGMFVKSSN